MNGVVSFIDTWQSIGYRSSVLLRGMGWRGCCCVWCWPVHASRETKVVL